jgi:hypothetical protein
MMMTFRWPFIPLLARMGVSLFCRKLHGRLYQPGPETLEGRRIFPAAQPME